MYTPNYGSLHESKDLEFNIFNTTFGGTTYSDMVKNGVWFVKEVKKWDYQHINNGNMHGTFGLIDNYGNLWSIRAFQQFMQDRYPNFTKIKDGFGQMSDEVIDTIQKMNTNLDLNIESIYPIIMLCAQQAMELVQLKNEHSKIKDIVEKLTTENAELKQNVTDLSNENDKLMDIIHKNRWLIVFWKRV